MNLQELKTKTPQDLLALAEQLDIGHAGSLRKQDMMFSILKQLADRGREISGGGVLEILSDGFGFLRAPEANYLPGPGDIYISPAQVRRFALRTGDSVEGLIRSPREGESQGMAPVLRAAQSPLPSRRVQLTASFKISPKARSKASTMSAVSFLGEAAKARKSCVATMVRCGV